jgi:NAD(P)-dependent dehydrogenase (short-subunit alcohol dehydrogenase family)
MDLGLSGRAAIVTGGSRGIGLAVAQQLTAEGAKPLLIARRAEALDAAAVRCGGGAQWLALDITQRNVAGVAWSVDGGAVPVII